ncbi:MAG: DotD/TraH family lipoprotein [Alphaproteobacteria bacterium]|nr:DotD/TraH family lipoprotein [Alphaproteobacteria bacterium]
MQTDLPNQRLQALMKPFSSFIVALGALVLLAGCDSTSRSSGFGGSGIATEPDIVTVKLAQAADKASQALDSIAGIEQQRNPAPSVENYANAPANLMQPVSIRWSGPIDQITKNLSERAGLRFRVKGNPPPVPLTVTIDAYQQPILHVLRDIGLQAGRRADIAVDGQGGAVELRYASVDQPEIHNAFPSELK